MGAMKKASRGEVRSYLQSSGESSESAANKDLLQKPQKPLNKAFQMIASLLRSNYLVNRNNLGGSRHRRLFDTTWPASHEKSLCSRKGNSAASSETVTSPT